jgi:uncharacterized membrane protein
VSTYDWLLFFHVTGAFLFLGAAVVAWVLGIAAALRERPSEIALLLGLTRFAAIGFGLGTTLLLVFGIWLVADLAVYDITDGWIVGALVLFVFSIVIGGIGGGRDKRTRMLAQRLASEGDQPSSELAAAVRDPRALAYNIASTLAAFGVLVLMIFKPGAL